MKKVFIDGSAGTTGLRIRDRLAQRDDIKLIELPEEKRKDTQARRKALNSADISFLCLPDAAAIEAADIVLMDDDPMRISTAIGISRKCLSIVKENIVFSLAVKFACLVLAAIGIADMWLAIFADVGVMIIAVLNAIRALRYKSE